MGSIEPEVQEARIGRSQPGVGLWSPRFFVLHFFESGLTLNPTINVIHLAFSYHYICLALLIALMGICDIGTDKVAYGFLCKQHHIQLMIGSLLIYSIC